MGPSFLSISTSANVEALKQAIKVLFELSGPAWALDVQTSRDAPPLKPSLPIHKLLQHAQLDRDDEDGNVVLYVKRQDGFRNDSLFFSPSAKERIWISLLRVKAYANGALVSTAAAFVFDIHQTSLFLLAPLHFVAGCRASCSPQFQEEIDMLGKDEGFVRSIDNFHVVQVPAEGGECDVTTFKISPEICWQASSEKDFAIFQIPLDDSWDCSVPGQAERDLEPLRKCSKQSEEELLRPLATQLYSPHFRFSISPAEPVRVLGFSATTAGRSIASAAVSAVRRVDLLLQNFSDKGFSGGLVVTSNAHVIGFLPSPLEPSAARCAYKVDGYPPRPSISSDFTN